MRLYLFTLIISFLPSMTLFADMIRLQHGGEIRGELLNDQLEADPVEMRTLSGAEVKIPREQVDFIVRRSATVEEYVTRSREIPNTVEAHLELAEWCRQRLLKEEREEQLELVLSLDPNHKATRRVLGYVEHQGEWMTRDELMAKRGYVRHKGRWITQQELELREKSETERKAEVEWYPRIRLWYAWITGDNPMRKADGLKQFRNLTDADSVPALTQVMGDQLDVDVRMLYVQILANFEGSKPVGAILDRYLYDQHDAVRDAALAALKPEQYATAMPTLLNALRDDWNPAVCRSAFALMKINEPTTVPALIDALVTSHKFKVNVPTGNAVSFSTTQGGRTTTNSPYGNRLPAEIEMMARTGQLPYGAIVIPHSATPQLSKTITVRVELKNAEVLAALESLTGKNLGYDERDWHLWWSLQKG